MLDKLLPRYYKLLYSVPFTILLILIYSHIFESKNLHIQELRKLLPITATFAYKQQLKFDGIKQTSSFQFFIFLIFIFFLWWIWLWLTIITTTIYSGFAPLFFQTYLEKQPEFAKTPNAINTLSVVTFLWPFLLDCVIILIDGSYSKFDKKNLLFTTFSIYLEI